MTKESNKLSARKAGWNKKDFQETKTAIAE